MHRSLKKNIIKKFFKYSIPSVISMWIFTIYTMVDGIFVAKGVGEEALAAINISMPLINMAFGLSVLFAIGASTKVSFYKGKNDLKSANKTFTLSSFIVFIIGLLFTVIALLNMDSLINILGSTLETKNYVKEYLSILVLFFPLYMTSYHFEVLIKADGYPNKAVITMVVGALVNIFLDYLFVLVFKWGIQGAAIATGLSQLMSFSVFFTHFIVKKTSFRFAKIKPTLKEILVLAKLGFADSLTEFSIAFVIFMYNHILIAKSGSEGLIIYTVISYISQLILMTMIGINQGMQPLVSLYYGKKAKQICRYILKVTLFSAIFLSLLAFLIGTIRPQPIVSLFIDSIEHPHLFDHGVYAFKLFSLSFLPLGMVIVFYGYFTALAKTRYAILISLSRGYIFVCFFTPVNALLIRRSGSLAFYGIV